MAKDLEDIAKLLGANIVGQIPDVGGGALGAVHLAKIYQARMQEIEGQKPSHPGNETSARNLGIPVSENTFQALSELAELLSTPQQKVSPIQVAAGLLTLAAPTKLVELRQAQTTLEVAVKQSEKAKNAWSESEQKLRQLLLTLGGISNQQAAG